MKQLDLTKHCDIAVRQNRIQYGILIGEIQEKIVE